MTYENLKAQRDLLTRLLTRKNGWQNVHAKVIKGELERLEKEMAYHEKNILVCKHCGSKEVARAKWVDYNTDGVRSEDYAGSMGMEWCFACNDETEVVGQATYEQLYKETVVEDQEDVD